MIHSYQELLAYFDEYDSPYLTLTLQYTFILYLVLGQFVLLGLWRLLTRRVNSPTTWRRNVAFALFLLAGQVGLLCAWPPLVTAWLATDRIVLADAVVTFHLALVVGVLVALVLVVVGLPFGWRWTRNFWFRLTQLLVIEVVAGQAIVGIECPLKTAERELRGGAGTLDKLENASAIGAWCNQTLYFTDPKFIELTGIRAANVVGSRSINALTTAVTCACVTEAPMEGTGRIFVILYGSVGLLALLTWVLVPPRLPWEGARAPTS